MANDNWIKAVFSNSSGGITGLTPTITIYKDVDSSVVVSAVAMTEVAVGIYKYNFSARVVPEGYQFYVDGGAGVTGTSRYIYGNIHSEAADVQVYMDANSTKLARLDANVSAVGSAGGWRGKPIVINFEKIVELLLAEKIGEKTLKDIFAGLSEKKEEIPLLEALQLIQTGLQGLQEKVDASMEFNLDISPVLKPLKQLMPEIKKIVPSVNKATLEAIQTIELPEQKEITIPDVTPVLLESEERIKKRIDEAERNLPGDIENMLEKRDAQETKRKGEVLNAQVMAQKLLNQRR